MQHYRRLGHANRLPYQAISPNRPIKIPNRLIYSANRPPIGDSDPLIACRSWFLVFGALNPVLTYVNTFSHTDKSHNDCKHIIHANKHIHTRSPIPGTRDLYVPCALTILRIVTRCTLVKD